MCVLLFTTLSKNEIILFASLWEVRARKGLTVRAAGGEGGETRQQITQKKQTYTKKTSSREK